MRTLKKIHLFAKSHSRLWEGLLMLYVLIVLSHTDSYFAIYLMMGIAAFVHYALCGSKNGEESYDRREQKFMKVMSVGIGLCMTFANFKLFGSNHLNVVKGTFIFLGSYYVVKHDLQMLYDRVNGYTWPLDKSACWSPRKVFLTSFAVIAAIDLVYLFGSAFPGTLTPDSVDQVHQIVTGVYRNHHPFWQTQVIRFWLQMGLAIWPENLTNAIAVYSTFLICFMAACFAFMLMTFREAKLPWKIIVLFLAFTAAMPYNISYSVTMWKNIMFSGAMLLFVTMLFRILHQLGSKELNLVLLAVSGLGICLWQSNGIPAFILAMGAFVYGVKTERKRLVSVAVLVTCMALLMVGPALKMLGVRQTEVYEALSVPQQQMARVLHDGKRISSQDEETLSRYANVNLMALNYNPIISDNTKWLIREDYFLAHKADYFKVWGKIGLRYPWEYAKAWVDETRGYWNGGYDYWIWAKGIDKRAKAATHLEAESKVHVKWIDKLYKQYFKLYKSNMLVVFLSIGLHVWILCLLAAYCLLKGKKDYLLAVPALSIIGTLLATTPVFSEFRYAYGVFTTIPVVLMAAFYKKP